MVDSAETTDSAGDSPEPGGQYIVVARRYRPQGFDDLVGQGMVSTALKNAIDTERVGHAYLFTGARGVGKTSTARILSKALNCQKGTSPTPCHECDVCESIAAGDDVDVLEIDGASNRGIDEIRQLRSNVSVRPSRSRYKIYIIDEVHMLTKEAFNALLKTLEEPPEHVKFIFCTTDPEKIPITVLSRCQRFDFSPVGADEIVTRLQFIVESEGSSADVEALRLLARKAAGSVRDSQSLLEQLMSFTAEKITVDAVHNMLGTAGATRLYGVVRALASHDAAGALSELDQAIGDGVDAGQLTEQLLGCLRDLMALSVGGGKELLLHSAESDAEELSKIANDWGTQNLLAAAQIVDEALARMRMVTHSRILLETALIRIAQLEDLQDLSQLITQIQSGVAPAAPAVKKKTEPPVTTAATAAPTAAPVGNAVNSANTKPAKPVDPGPATPDADQGAAASQSNSAAVGKSVSLDRGNPDGVVQDAVAAPASSTPENPRDTAAKPANPSPAPATGGPVAAPPSAKDASPVADGTPNAATNETASEAVVPSGDAANIWQQAISELDGMAADAASDFVSAANSAPNRLVVTFASSYTSSKSFCERPERHSEMEKIVSRIAGRKLKLEFALRADVAHEKPAKPTVSARQREREISQRPFVQRAVEMFSGEITGVTAAPRNDD